VHVRLGRPQLTNCEGRVPTPAGQVHLRWRKDGEQLLYTVSVPRGHTVEVENLTGLALVDKQSSTGGGGPAIAG
jgi:alpha-L-rhamnosidase